MNKVAANMKSLLFISRARFSKDLFLSGSNPIRERVVSTPSWPVPYYQRVSKAYPIRCTHIFIKRIPNRTSEALTYLLMMLLG
jgi:hypothetical protein